MKIVKNSCNFCQVNYVNKNKTNSKIIIKKVQFVSLIFCKKKKKVDSNAPGEHGKQPQRMRRKGVHYLALFSICFRLIVVVVPLVGADNLQIAPLTSYQYNNSIPNYVESLSLLVLVKGQVAKV